MKLFFRHKQLRKFQDELIKDVAYSLENKKILLAHAPMGLGKTDAVISPAISKALEEDLTVFFLTPKISQHKIALEVAKGLNNEFGLGIKALDMVGRRYMCTNPSLKELDHDNFYAMCKNYRENENCYFYDNAVGFSKKAQAEASLLVEELKKENCVSHNFMDEFGRKNNACSYELLMKLSSSSNLIIADYFHIFIPDIREIFLKKSNKAIEKSIIIVDEAHNLAERVRSHISKSLNDFMLSKADMEAEMIGAEKPKMAKAFSAWAEKKLNGAKEKLIAREEIEEFVKSYYELSKAMVYFEEIGTNYSKATSKSSYSIKVARFLASLSFYIENSVFILRKTDSGFYSVSKKFLDPYIATSILNKTYSSILMSGTLLPLEMHRDTLGIEKERAVEKAYLSPFSASNRLLVITKNLTTRYSLRNSENYRKFAEKIDLIFQKSPGGVAVFFPSFEVQNNISKYLLSFPKLEQRSNALPLDNHKLLELFKQRKSLLLGVQGGSLSEGIDLNNGEIKVLVVLGLALEEMNVETKALIDHYERKFKKGLEYGYVCPAITKALQAGGRAIRKEEDKAVIIFMDERFSWINYFKLLPKENYLLTENPELHVERFFS